MSWKVSNAVVCLLDLQLTLDSLSSLIQKCIGTKDANRETEFWPLPEYTARLYESLISLDWRNPNKNSKPFAHRNATWHLCIALALQNVPTRLKPLDARACTASIESSLVQLRVEEIPGIFREKLSYRKTIQLRRIRNPGSNGGHAAWKPRGIEDLLDRATLSVRSGIFHERIEDPPPSSPTFLFQTPFRELPKTIEDGCNGLICLYRESNLTAIISTQIQVTLDTFDLEDPIIQLALILTSVLSIPTPLPWCPRNQGGTKFADHEKKAREKDRWRAVLFLKMMWFRHPQLAVKEFVDCLNEKQSKPHI